MAPEVWTCRLPSSGEVIALVRTDAEAGQVRDMLVFTLAEVAIAIEAFGPATLEAKRRFPGATVTAVRKEGPGKQVASATRNSGHKETRTMPKLKPPLPPGSYQNLSKKMPKDTRYKGESYPVSNIEARYEEHMAKQRAAAARLSAESGNE